MEPKDQYNNNLEEFFRQHLENHSAEPSSNFWALMESSIPPKPPFWVLWAGTAKQFLLPTVLLSSLVIVSFFYWKTLQEKENLSLFTINQQAKIAHIEQQNQTLQNQLKVSNLKTIGGILTDESKRKNSILPIEEDPVLNNVDKEGLSQKATSSSTLPEAKEALYFSAMTETLPSVSIEKNKNKSPSASFNKDSIEKATLLGIRTAQTTELFTPSDITPKNHHLNPIIASTQVAKNRNITSFLSPNKNPLITRINPKIALSQIAEIKGVPLPVGRYSFEGGALFIVQKMKSVIDSTVSAAGVSYGASLLMNFEINRWWNIQSGFQIKNTSSPTITRSYNCIPLNIKRKFVLNNGCLLEPRLGLGMNFFINGVTQEIIGSGGAASFYMDLTSSLTFAIPFNNNLHFILEPNIGYSMTPIVGDEKASSYGFHIGIRYEN